MIHHTANKGEIQPKSSAMIPHKANGEDFLLVETPLCSAAYTCDGGQTLFIETPHEWSIIETDLPEGKWELISWADALTESQASEIVEKTEKGFMSYDLPFTCSTALESLQSLLEFNGLKGETTLILKQL